jgi:hypothetical protein
VAGLRGTRRAVRARLVGARRRASHRRTTLKFTFTRTTRSRRQ